MSGRLPYYYNAQKDSIPWARRLRRRSTAAEDLLWKIVRRKALHGFKFRRQHPIGEYTADFYCHKALLVVEVDGDVHNEEEVIEKDRIRDNTMRRLGLTILRFSNEDVFFNTDIVVSEIEGHLGSAPSPRPSPAGEGVIK